MTVWRTSSLCSLGDCVEVFIGFDGIVSVRDSKNPAGGTLEFDADEWGAFVAAVKAGEFDPPGMIR